MSATGVAWFCAGCGLALLSVVGLRAVVDEHAGRAQVETQLSDPSVASDLVAPEASKLPWSEVPIQRPHRAENARLPPLPLPQAARAVEVAHVLDDARLPADAEVTAGWNPDDARLPEPAFFAFVQRARWNPDRATLPTADTAQWDPDDARLPGLQ